MVVCNAIHHISALNIQKRSVDVEWGLICLEKSSWSSWLMIVVANDMTGNPFTDKF